MATPIPCEALATKAELQELREQINKLFGRLEDNPNQVKDVLTEGNYTGTIFAASFISEVGAEAVKVKAKTNLGSSLKDNLIIKNGNGNYFRSDTVDKLNKTLQKTQDLATAASQQATKNAQRLTAIGAVATQALNLANLGITLIQILGFNNAVLDSIDSQLRTNENDFQTTFRMIQFNKEQTLEQLEAQKQALLEQIRNNRQTADANQLINGKIRQDLGVAKSTIEYLQTELTATREQLTEQLGETQDLTELFENYRGEAQEEIQALRDANLDLTEKLEDIQFQLDESSLYFDTSLINIEDADITIVDQEDFINNLSSGLEGFEAEVINLNFDNLSPEQIEEKETEVRARITTIYDYSLAPNTGSSSGGGGFPVGARESLTTTQNKTIELAAKNAGIDPNTIPNFPISEWQITESNNPFSQIIDNLLLNINPNTTDTNGDIPNVDIEQLSNDVSNKITSDIDPKFASISVAIAGLATTLSQVNTNTAPATIGNTMSEAVCQNTQTDGCITQNVTNPLKNIMDNLKDNLDLINAALNSTILGIVRNTNTVVNSGWASATIDKTLNAANFALSLHNAVMLSNNVADTVLETIDVILDIMGVTDFEGNPIDISKWLTNTLRTVVQGVVGAETYTDLSIKLTAANRIYQAGMNILDNVTDLIDTTIELDEYTGENISKIGNALRNSGIVPYDAYGQMIEDLDNRQFSKWLRRLEQAEEATDNIYSIADSIRDIKEIGQDLKNSREEFQTALQDSNLAFTEAETELDTEIENIPEPTTEDEARG